MQGSTDARFMARAIRLAERGMFTAHPNPAVGCVLVRQGEIVGEGFHLEAGRGHAEANALAQAAGAAEGATAYVSLEPCSFHGRTPSCAKALVDARVTRVVVATLDPDPRNAGAGIRLLEAAGIVVETGLLSDSARALVRGHVARYETGRPFVTLKLAMSLDGKTALANGESKWITSPAARADVQRLRARNSAIVTGVQTVIDDDPLLSVRANELDAPEAALAARVARPVYVLDSGGRIPGEARLLQQPGTVVVTCADLPVASPAERLRIPARGDRVDLEKLLAELAVREHGEVLFECGATLAGALVAERLVDELVIYTAPRLMGGSARSLLNLPELGRMSDLVNLVIRDVRQVGSDIRITAGLA